MDCISTAIANLLSHIGYEQTVKTLRLMIEREYKLRFGRNLSLQGVTVENFNKFMEYFGLYQIATSEMISTIEDGNPIVAVIQTGSGLHMIEVVGYYDDWYNTDAF